MIVRGSFLLLLLGLCLLVLGQPSSFFGSHNLFYRGPDSIIYGPFPQEQVFQWYDAGYFDAALEVSYQEDQPFFPLRDLLALPNSAAPDAFELPHENSKLTTQNIQNKPKSLPSPKRALKFLKKRAGKLLSKSKQLLTKSHDDFDTGRSHLPIALHDSTSNQIVEDDTYEEMEELSAIESEEEKFLQKNSNPNPPLSSQKSSKKGIFEFSKARKISVKSLGVGDRGLWDNENAADSVVLDVGSSRFSEWIEQFQTFLKTTVNRGPRVFVLSLLTCVQYGFLITAYFYFEQTKLTEFFTAASNPNSDLGVNWRHFAALMQTSWWRDTNWPIIISQWLGENRDWLVVSFLIGGFLATNVARNKMSTQREAESRPVLNADSLILCIGHIWLLLRNCKVSWLTIIFSLPVLYTMFVRHKVLSRSHNDLFSNYLAQDIAVSR